MQAPLPKDAGRRHLVSCPECGAYNGLNATDCWQCECSLPADLAPEPTTQRAREPDPAAPGAGAIGIDAGVDLMADARGQARGDLPTNTHVEAPPVETRPDAAAAFGASTWVPIEPPSLPAANDDRALSTLWPADSSLDAAPDVPAKAGAAAAMALPPALQALAVPRAEPRAPRRWAIGGAMLTVAALVVWWFGPRAEPELPTLASMRDGPPGGYAATRSPALGRAAQPITLESAATQPREPAAADAAAPPAATLAAAAPTTIRPAAPPAYAAVRMPALGTARVAMPDADAAGGPDAAAPRPADRPVRPPAARAAPRAAPPLNLARSTAAAPATAPAGPCTPQVVALGLCGADNR